MTSGTYTIVAGTTKPIQFQLLEAGAAIILSGCTVTLLLSDRASNVIANPGTVTITDAVNGKVQLAPLNTLTFNDELGPYSARWKIVDGSGFVSFCPNGSRDIWNIVAA